MISWLIVEKLGLQGHLCFIIQEPGAPPKSPIDIWPVHWVLGRMPDIRIWGLYKCIHQITEPGAVQVRECGPSLYINRTNE